MCSRLQKYTGMNITSVRPVEGDTSDRYGQNTDFAPRQKLNGVYRRGKFMVFMLDDCALLAHNAMSGYWDELDDPWTFDYVEGKRTSKASDVRALIEIEDEGKTHFIQFHDARKFGSLKIVTPFALALKLSKLGPEIVGSSHLYEPTAIINEEQFIEIFKNGKKKLVKELLMDQDKMAGIGNIYAAEACWAANVNPFRAANTLTEFEATSLYCSSVAVLGNALDRNLDYSRLNIYRRSMCPADHTPTKVEKLKGRTTYWCPTCQK
jgi:formamidopyrimidine-DNA glycosylase